MQRNIIAYGLSVNKYNGLYRNKYYYGK